jgi:hypothetical protein
MTEEEPDDPGQAVGLTRKRRSKPGKAFGEDPALAPVVAATPAPNSYPDRN